MATERGQTRFFFAFHELRHYAAECLLGFERGFYGLVASGWEMSDTTGKGSRGRLPDETLAIEHLVDYSIRIAPAEMLRTPQNSIRMLPPTPHNTIDSPQSQSLMSTWSRFVRWWLPGFRQLQPFHPRLVAL